MKKVVIDNSNFKSFLETYRTKSKKAEVILMRANNMSIQEIINKTGCSKRTIINYINMYLNCDENEFRHFILKKNYRSKLYEHKQKITSLFKDNPPKTYKEATNIIQNKYDIRISETQVRMFLNKCRIYSLYSRKLNINLKYKIRSKYCYSELDNYRDIIEKEYKENPPKSYRIAKEWIYKTTGIKRSESFIRNYLNKKLGIYTSKSIKYYKEHTMYDYNANNSYDQY